MEHMQYTMPAECLRDLFYRQVQNSTVLKEDLSHYRREMRKGPGATDYTLTHLRSSISSVMNKTCRTARSLFSETNLRRLPTALLLQLQETKVKANAEAKAQERHTGRDQMLPFVVRGIVAQVQQVR